MIIAYIKGTITHIADQSIVVQNNMVGFDLFVPDVRIFKTNQTIELYTHMHWNAEQGPSLYGFLTQEEKSMFLLITKCPGIGPKIALSALSTLQPHDFVLAITQGNIDLLSSIPGIGKRKAEQMALQLKNSADKLLQKGDVLSSGSNREHWKELSGVLGALNYSKEEVGGALAFLQQLDETDCTFDQLLRKALSHLNKRH